MKIRSFVSTLVFAAFVTLCHGTAVAEPSGSEKAAAEALFQEGTELSATDDLAKACGKFEASQQLDPALGTMLRLADCWDRVGRTASAWAMFREVSSMAATRNQPDRERIASERAADLAKRLSKLEIKVDPNKEHSGLEIRLNGVVIPRPTWNTAIPVDPGRQRVEVSAPKFESWAGSVEVPKGPAARSIQVPQLAPKQEEPERAELMSAGPLQPAPRDNNRGSVQRTIGYVTSGLGLLGIATGGFLSYRAYDLNRQSLDECRSDAPNACTSSGVDIRDNAHAHASGATVAFGVGAGLLTTGVLLIATAPRGERKTAIRVSTGPIASGGRLNVEGVW